MKPERSNQLHTKRRVGENETRKQTHQTKKKERKGTRHPLLADLLVVSSCMVALSCSLLLPFTLDWRDGRDRLKQADWAVVELTMHRPRISWCSLLAKTFLTWTKWRVSHASVECAGPPSCISFFFLLFLVPTLLYWKQ